LAAEEQVFSSLEYPDSNWLDYMSSAANPGVYLTWERRSTSPVAFYQILRGPTIDSEFSTIATLPFPAYEYVDSVGNPSHYYKIKEISADNTVISISSPIMGSELLIKASLMFQIRELMNIHIESEEAIFEHGNRSSCRFVHKYWNSYPRPEIRISGASESGDGEPFIHLDDVSPIYQTINGDTQNYPQGLKFIADYNGRLFKITTVGQAPFYYDAALITGATYYLLRSLLVQLKSREFRLLLADPNTNDIFNQVKEDARLYKEDFDEFLKKIPIARYPTTKTVVTPEYMLPGGRSRFFRAMFKGMGG